ncbi:ABC transporter substrate-binding protein [Synechocystis sp. PCC 7339]|uniref:ABC transporter substrate-binding protein n=1 Tax=unclassified Synechocystis TaxID=2640012 RepID=UPI001BAEE821|nr:MULTISPECIES: ABC transporter substrate-binding protein [unclassified Synechocystis]QUS61704.1 ABC transporter substrate-binding protein [Synechocystis sp. PCC 7338]UAJ73902.1 ABC transporter substrate-binding protein [Synechocystis sp. PCC 7339]
MRWVNKIAMSRVVEQRKTVIAREKNPGQQNYPSGRSWGQKLISTVLCCLVMAFSLGGCFSPELKDQVVFSVLSDPKTFNAVLSQESPNVFGYIYEGLIRENPLTGERTPALAQSWEISPDNLTITFTLRDGLRWSDGEPLTVDDVLFSYNDLYLNPKIPNNYRDGLKVGESQAEPKITKVGDRQVAFNIPEPFAPFLDTAQFPILPAHILRETVEKTDENGNPLLLSTWGTNTPPDQIVVNGPYKLARYVTSQRVIFSKNPYYWEKGPNGESLPYIPRVVWAIVESTDTSLLQFRSGSLDSLGVPPESFSLLKQEEERGNFVIYNGGPTYTSTYLTFNLNQGKRQGKPLVDPIKSRWFNNLNFRQAIAYGIDRERMVNNIYRGLGEKQNSFIPVQSPFFNPDVKVYSYDPEKAQALLKAGGFTYNNQQQLLDDQGNRVRFVLNTNAGNKVREALGTQIQEDLSKLGIQVDFSPISFGVLVDKLSNSLEWDAVVLGLTGGNDPHIPNVWYVKGNLHMFNQHPQAGAQPLQGQTVAPWEQNIANLALKASQIIPQQERSLVYDQMQMEVQEYLPFIYLVSPYSLSAVRNRFCGIEYSALGGAFWNLPSISFCDHPPLAETSSAGPGEE